MTMTVRDLRLGKTDSRKLEDATEQQRRHAKELKDLAAALRTPPADKLAALKRAFTEDTMTSAQWQHA